ncbi:bifunctional folylpolyglutamate synthase/dihydrofolate synthase [Deinococcus metallilatus]|uniref:tetrahydrofolate synthase n=1 Tax=Deinococcus metallilatus TaxID=1211322 RepID=A0AAJ5F0R1_9DEIO|nr:folylpolyglutamate synthase/dihydrofolate synthase family protein [Deinococcus metallilatus]MBB5297054.1 dihydrofolate synthase/folylpolyglutamate synthase [Deinococcus metallilatus]QBY07818.1 bifunctional folylpolyglutamate synthase/dihydrofolate synthase [Deinococcus metallilatus]RXJ13167.1 bifunctional folylpolyglutamate synthase/dihydrofolate synthase [Deinococcus metallilatus]TLK23060.1 bifunctional folylpolyglutamate synthase/dihydrofolate synthase [Deinococcus metallilatus]GMA16019.1
MTDLDWLFARQRFGVHPGLTRVRALLARLDDPQQAFRTVLVGGTNGKGSTAATLAAMLTAGGERAGLFTSPHLTRFSERFVVAGQERPEEEVLDALHRVRPHAEAVEASFFEVVTALGCLLFAEAGVTTAVMEVGLGGRLDATNALDPGLSVITNIALDHTEILGETREAIAREKAGILRAGRPAVTGVAADLLPLLEAQGADLWVLGREVKVEALPLGWDGWDVRVGMPKTALTFRTPLLGAHGARNAALAAAAAHRLGVGEEAIHAGAANVRWPGRLEVLPWRGGRVLLDGAHNPDGARALAEALRGLDVGRLPIVFGAAADKDIAGVAEALRPLASEVILTRAVLSPRAADPAALAPSFAGVPVRLADTPADALDRLPPAGLAVVCGSLYLIGEVRPLLLGEAGERRERWQ